MQIFINSLDNKTFTLEIPSTAKGSELLDLVAEHQGIPVTFLRILNRGKPFITAKSVQSQGIHAGSGLIVSLKLLGGGCCCSRFYYNKSDFKEELTKQDLISVRYEDHVLVKGLKRYIKETVDLDSSEIIHSTVNSEFSTHCLAGNTELLNLIRRSIAKDPQRLCKCEEFFWKLLKFSRINEEISTASSNALTILNYCGCNFSNRSLIGVKAPGVNLINGEFNQVQLRSADLRWAKIYLSSFIKTTLTNSNLIQVEFPLRMNLCSPSQGILCIAIYPDNKSILSGNTDNTIRIHDLETGELLRTLKGHTGSVNTVAIATDQSFAVSGSEDGTIRIWDLEKGKQFQQFYAGLFSIKSVVISSDSKLVISGGTEKVIRVWSLKLGAQIRQFEGNYFNINTVAITSDNEHIVAGSKSETIKI